MECFYFAKQFSSKHFKAKAAIKKEFLDGLKAFCNSGFYFSEYTYSLDEKISIKYHVGSVVSTQDIERPGREEIFTRKFNAFINFLLIRLYSLALYDWNITRQYLNII